MLEAVILDYKNGLASADDAIRAIRRSYPKAISSAEGRCRSVLRAGDAEVNGSVDYAIWRLVSAWNPKKGKLADHLKVRLAQRAIDHGSFRADRVAYLRMEIPYDPEVFKQITGKSSKSYPSLDPSELYSVIPETDEVRKSLLQFMEGGYSYKQAIRHAATRFPDVPRYKIRKAARELRKSVRDHIHRYYPHLSRDYHQKEVIMTAPPEIVKETPPKKAAVVNPKPNKKAKAKATAKPKKSNGAKKNGEAGKPKVSKQATTTKEKAPKAAVKPSDQIPEKDVLSAVDRINKLVTEQEQSRTKNDWKVGRELVWIRDKVEDGTWGRVCSGMIQGIAGRELKKSSIDKKMKLFRMFPKSKDEKRAVAIGVGRIDQICRLPLIEEREMVIAEGVRIKDKDYKIEDLKVRELGDYIDAYMEQKHKAQAKTPQEKFVAAFRRQSKGLQKLIDESSRCLKTRVFEDEQIAEVKESLGEMKECLKAVVLKARAKKK